MGEIEVLLKQPAELKEETQKHFHEIYFNCDL